MAAVQLASAAPCLACRHEPTTRLRARRPLSPAPGRVIAMDHIIRFTDLQWASLQSGLWARADVETGAIVFGEPTPSPRSASVAVRNIVFVPFEAYRVRKSDFIETDPIWMNRQCFEARRGGLSVFTAHTH